MKEVRIYRKLKNIFCINNFEISVKLKCNEFWHSIIDQILGDSIDIYQKKVRFKDDYRTHNIGSIFLTQQTRISFQVHLRQKSRPD